MRLVTWRALYISPCCKVTFYSESSAAAPQHFDYSGDDAVREFSSAAFNPAGETVVVGTDG